MQAETLPDKTRAIREAALGYAVMCRRMEGEPVALTVRRAQSFEAFVLGRYAEFLKEWDAEEKIER